MRNRTTIVVAALAASATLAGPASAQDAGDILENALEKYAEHVEGISDYTVTYDGFMGQGAFTTYYEKRTVDGYPLFQPVMVQGVETAEAGFNPYARFPELAARAAYGGAETIDGVQAHRVDIDDVEGLGFVPPNAGEGSFRPETMSMWIDDEGLIRRMRMEGSATYEGESKPVTMIATLGDYRTVEGMPFPFETSIAMEGAMAAGGMSDADAEEARQKLAELREQIEAMPEAQREQMQRLMGPQMKQLESLVGSGTMEMTLTVRDLKVNTGPPDPS